MIKQKKKNKSSCKIQNETPANQYSSSKNFEKFYKCQQLLMKSNFSFHHFTAKIDSMQRIVCVDGATEIRMLSPGCPAVGFSLYLFRKILQVLAPVSWWYSGDKIEEQNMLRHSKIIASKSLLRNAAKHVERPFYS